MRSRFFCVLLAGIVAVVASSCAQECTLHPWGSSGACSVSRHGIDPAVFHQSRSASTEEPGVRPPGGLGGLDDRASVQAPPTRVIRGPATCRTCSIVLTPGPRLGDMDGPGAMVAEPSTLATDTQGRYYLTQFAPGQPPLVFDHTGQFLQTLGGVGQGPGEFNLVRYVAVGDADTVYVTDAKSGRLSLFSPDLVFRRSATDANVARALTFAVLRNGKIVAATDVSSRDRIGYPLHLYGSDLTFITSFGADTPSFDPGHPLLSRRRLARSRDGGVWAARATEYVIDRFDAEGKRSLRVVRDEPWFRPHLGANLIEEQEPKPRIMGIAEDSLGRLWVLLVTKGAEWKRSIGYTLPSRLGGGRSPIPVITDEDGYYDTVLEVIDPGRGQLVATHRMPQAVLFLVGAQHVATRRETQSGEYYMQLWAMSLRDTARTSHP